MCNESANISPNTSKSSVSGESINYRLVGTGSVERPTSNKMLTYVVVLHHFGDGTEEVLHSTNSLSTHRFAPR